MLMLDIETLGLRPGAPIPTIGYCHFDWDGIKDHGTIAINLGIGNIGKSPDIGTIKFWLQQSPEAIAKTFFRPQEEQRDWVTALNLLSTTVKFDEKEFGEGVWANGPLFDLAHLEFWYDQMSEKTPWSHRSPRDCRTIYETAQRLTGWDRDEATERLRLKHPELVAHDAEHDAVLQALLVIDANDALMRQRDRAQRAPVSVEQYPRDAIDAG